MQILRKTTAVLLIAALSLPACILAPVPAAGQIFEGSGMLAEETRAVSGITAVQLAMPGTLHIELGATDSLRIAAEDNLLSSIRTEARGGELVIESSPGVDLRPREPID
jgi:hypothetical protein